VALIGGMAWIERLTGGRPSGAITIKNQIVFDGKFEAGSSEFALDAYNRRKSTPIRQMFNIRLIR